MNKEKPYFLKRVIAYLIDLIIVMLLSGIISTIFIHNENYQSESQKLLDLTKKYTDGVITKEEYSEEFDIINYYMTKDSVDVTIINIIVAIVYYVILCYYCGGITLGKYIMKLRIVSANDKKLNLGHYLLRALMVNLILSHLVSVVLVQILSKDSFISIYPKISNILTILLLVTFIFMMYREDGRGLHDLIANTQIVSTKKDIIEEKEEKEEIVEAQVLEEKKKSIKNTKKKRDVKK